MRVYNPKMHVTEYKRAGSNERLVGNNGEINAQSRQDLIHGIADLLSGVKTGVIARGDLELSNQERRTVIEARQQELQAALADKTGEKWMALGETITEEIYEALGREGFTRKILGFKPIKRGDIARIAVRKKDVLAYYFAGTQPTVVASWVRQNYLTPPDAYLLANIKIDNLELELADTDLLEHKYNDGLEQILRQEDVRTITLANTAAASGYNDLVYFNAFTPSVFQSMRQQIARWTIPVSHALLSIDLWNDILADTEFASYYDPVSKHQVIMEGTLGSFFGVELLTDGFRYETLQVLQPGNVYFFGTPKALGCVMERKPLTVENTSGAIVNQPWRGWFMEQIESQIIVNGRAVIRGQRA